MLNLDLKRYLVPILLFFLIGGFLLGLFFLSDGSNELTDINDTAYNDSIYEVQQVQSVIINSSDSGDNNTILKSENSDSINDSISVVDYENESMDSTDVHIISTNNSEIYVNSIGMEFVLIPEGKFVMGAEGGKAIDDDELPLHNVKIGYNFYLGMYEVTQEQWEEVMGYNPSLFKVTDNPVESVSWNDAQKFISKLNKLENTDKYRLPSESEWEYACRAGNYNEYSLGNIFLFMDNYGWDKGNSGSTTHSVGEKSCNSWGLYDMHGNVNEWVQDKYFLNYKMSPTDGSAWEGGNSNRRVIRGGSWFNEAIECQSFSRDCYNPTFSAPGKIGFRVVMET